MASTKSFEYNNDGNSRSVVALEYSPRSLVSYAVLYSVWDFSGKVDSKPTLKSVVTFLPHHWLLGLAKALKPENTMLSTGFIRETNHLVLILMYKSPESCSNKPQVSAIRTFQTTHRT
ncbi:hypothetical protein PoB_001389100 [Plakobranchus ocellatus]|uniref:Uncharacterized protein n=1 Tax=Plakobranchus ocellatus TaxID=259542 RepID=A0AAV3YYD4_9GAST|nr:hypothetical protein PoB_001389100 [Plakobranchus ocellatus]